MARTKVSRAETEAEALEVCRASFPGFDCSNVRAFELEDEELLVDEINSDHEVEEGDGGMDDGGDEEEENEEVSDEDEDASSSDEEEGHEGDGKEQNHGRQDEEVKELEKEYMDLRNQGQ
ncbi:uncharacterized protein J3R85_004312 [Psidium guajava]|nr:uncharacterized protein J3R85_004312 [Psidium guajava]